MLLNILIIIVGVALVIGGADRMTEGAVSLAQRMKIPEIVIGLTIVAMGTSMPEFCVSMVSALKSTTAMAVGNVVGSNIFNTMLIVGMAALVAPMMITHSTVKKDMPWTILASVLLACISIDGNISRLDALLLTLTFFCFIAYTLRESRKGQPTSQDQEQENKKTYKPMIALLLVLAGLGCLILGSNLFVDAATKVARQLGVSDAVIGLTIVAGGTSLPELATSVVAAKKGQSAIAIGNVIGSNVYNILMIIGVTGLICPMNIEGITFIDLGTMLGSILLLWLFTFTKFKVERWEGGVLTLLFFIYMGWLIWNAI